MQESRAKASAQKTKSPALQTGLIGYDSGWGCADRGCADGPDAVDTQRLQKKMAALGVDLALGGTLGLKKLARAAHIKTRKDSFPLVNEGLKRLSAHVRQNAKSGRISIVLGGDHSSAIGTWSGIVSAHRAEGRFGLIWLDAHMDAHTPETADEGKWGGWWHGRPVAALCGHGEKEFTHLASRTAKLSPKHLSLIGLRSFEPGEQAFVKRNKISAAFMQDVKAKGFDAVFKTALQRATRGTDGFGLSIDLDGFDPSDAPGVGTAEKGGLKAKDVLHTLRGIGRHPKFKGLEIVEFNPHHDKSGKTARLIEKIILAVFAAS